MEETKKSKSFIREAIDLLSIFILMYLLFTFVLMSVRVDGQSMEPNFYNGDRGIMLRSLPANINNPNYQDVVVVEIAQGGESELIVKRVIAKPNDRLMIKDNQIYVNGQMIEDDSRALDTYMDDYSEIKLGEDEYFVLGDNRNISRDSRIIGTIKRQQIKAINGFMFWPLGDIGFMK